MTTTNIGWSKQVTLIDQVLSLTLVHGGDSCRVERHRVTWPHPLSPDICQPSVYKVDYVPGLWRLKQTFHIQHKVSSINVYRQTDSLPQFAGREDF